MENLTIDIVKDNRYFLKSPFAGELILFYVDANDSVQKDQVIGVLKTDHGYVDLVSDFPGIIESVNVKLNGNVRKWQDIIVVNLKEDSADTPDYDIIYTFQQETFPKFIYNDTAKLLKGIAHEEGEFVFYLFKKFYENYNKEIPFRQSDFDISETLVEDRIVLIGIDWPKLSTPLLTLRSYILIDTVKESVGYFVCERSLENKLMISFIIQIEKGLKRFDYGEAPDDLTAEKEKIVNIFINYLSPKKRKSN